MYGHVYGRLLSSVGTEVRSTDLNKTLRGQQETGVHEERAHLPARCFGKSCAIYFSQNQRVLEQDNGGFGLRLANEETHIIAQLVGILAVFDICHRVRALNQKVQIFQLVTTQAIRGTEERPE